jgi:hypothetical protein
MAAQSKNFSRWIPLSAMGVGIWAIGGSSALASLVIPGGAADYTPGTMTSLTGLVLQATDDVPYADDYHVSPVFAGYLDTSVYYDPSTLGMDFTYQVVAYSGYPDTVHQVNLSYFNDGYGDAYSVDLYYVTDSGSGGLFTDATLGADSGTLDLIYQASAGDGIAPGKASDIVVVKTDATSYDEGGLTSYIDGGGDTEFTQFEPAGPVVVVPEPMSLGLLAAGVVICGVRRPRRRI